MISVSGTYETFNVRKEPIKPVKFLDDTVNSLFKKLGYEMDWDTSRRDGLVWDEIYFKDKLYFQIQVGVTLGQFKEWLLADSDFEPEFMVASGRSEKELTEFYNSFFNFKTKKFKGEK